MSECMNKLASQDHFSTFGWNMVSASSVEYLNEQIIQQKSSPKSWCQSVDQLEISGEFGDWQVVKGGAGKLVHMSIPLKTISLKKEGDSNSLISLTHIANAIIEVQLTFLEEVTVKNKLVLKVKTQSNSSDTEESVSIINLILSPEDQKKIDEVSLSYIQSGLHSWLVNHLEEFNHIFAVIDVVSTIDTKKPWYWAKPTAVDYAYVDLIGDKNSQGIFGILSQTLHHSPNGLEVALDHNVLSGNHQSALCVQNVVMLKEMIFPGLLSAFKQASSSNFSIDEKNVEISLVSEFSLDDVKHDGITYHPKMTSFTLRMLDSEIEISSETDTEISPGIHAWAKSSSTYNLILGKNNKGEQTLQWNKLHETSTHGTTVSDGVTITAAVAAGIVAIAAVIIDGLTGGAFTVVIFLIAALIEGVISSVALIEQLIVKNDSPSFSDAFNVLSNQVAWNTDKKFVLKDIYLSGGLQLLGSWEATV